MKTIGFPKIILSLCILFLVLGVMTEKTSAKMSIMTDQELSEITGHGFSDFSLTQENGLDVARMNFNIQASTYAQIAAMQMGHYDGGWDQNWVNVDMGSQSVDLVCNDFFFEARFENISDSAMRQFKGITVGYRNVTGAITAQLNAFTGSIQGVGHQRADLGNTTINLSNEAFFINIDADTGITFQIGN